MSERDALLAAIIAHPDEDTPRLAFADFLDENGDEGDRAWADLIRWQFARCGNSPIKLCRAEFSDTRGWWWRFDNKPRPKYRRVVRGMQLPRELAPGDFAVVNRGFVERVRCPQYAWRAHGPAIVGSHPIRFVQLTNLAPHHSGLGYGWFSLDRERESPDARPAAELGSKLFDYLRGWIEETPSGNTVAGRRYRVYETVEAANKALSDAAIETAKSHPV